MAGWRVSGGILLALSLAFSSSLRLATCVVAGTTTGMALTFDSVAVTPAAAEAPSDGRGPAISSVTRDPDPQPLAGSDIPIQATVTGNPTTVSLTYIVNFNLQIVVPMTAGPSGIFSAAIPSSSFAAGDMVRWSVEAMDAQQQKSSSPPPALGLYGTIIKDPAVVFQIPVMEWHARDPTESMKQSGANGSSVYFLGRFYDNLFVRRKGVTSLSWPKPKLKFELPKEEFIYKPNLNRAAKEKKVDKFDLNSLYYEPGQKSYMREPIAYQVLQDAGAVSAVSFHIILRLNGAFYGLYTYVENDDNDYLERNGLEKAGALIKPTSGSAGNLAFSTPLDQLQYSYEQQNHKRTASFWPQLYAFTQGMAGNSKTPRSKFVFDAIDLPETINTMAVLTMLLTQDRCTKNYLLYQNINTSRWQMFAYDLKSSLNADKGYGGKSATDYCTLECPQWNSPLYCDHDHPQDVTAVSNTPWTYITASSIGRKLLQAPATSSVTGVNVNITNPDVNLVAAGNSPSGPAGTFNHLIDLITQVPETRQMYMRRLRTLTDYYYPSGRLASVSFPLTSEKPTSSPQHRSTIPSDIDMITSMYNSIKEAAEMDNEKWCIGNITMGYQQLLQEQIPTRQKQLLEMYGPQGSVPLLPASQPIAPPLTLGKVDASSPQSQQFVEVKNPLSYAVDVSNWKISGAAMVTLRPGTVIASGSSLIVATDVAGFQQRTSSPTVGQGLQVVGSLSGNLGGDLQLSDDMGSVIASSAVTSTTG